MIYKKIITFQNLQTEHSYTKDNNLKSNHS